MKETRIIFMGTPEFAVTSLQSLHEAYTVAAVVTRPDCRGGRGKQLQFSPVKAKALQLGLPIRQPAAVRDAQFQEQLQKERPDFIITAAFGRILPAAVLQIPKYAALNIHASLLPRWRGAAPIHRAIMAGDEKTGVTIMYMDAGMDTGDILYKRSIPVSHLAAMGEIHDQLSDLGAGMIVSAVSDVLRGIAPCLKQNENEATAAPPLRPEEEMIDWSKPAGNVHNLVRGMNPWPGAYTFHAGERLKIWSGKTADDDCRSYLPGEITAAGNDGIYVGTGGGIFQIMQLQPAGKKKMPAGDYLRGKGLKPGDFLGLPQ